MSPTLIIIATIVSIVHGLGDIPENPCVYSRTYEARENDTTLSNYVLKWSLNEDEDRINFVLRHETQFEGNFWTGIAFGNSMGYLDFIRIRVNNGRVYVDDAYARGYGEPMPDEQQDVIMTEAIVIGGTVTVGFSRPLKTNDLYDMEISDGCVAFAFPTHGGLIGQMHGEVPEVHNICNLVTKCRVVDEEKLRPWCSIMAPDNTSSLSWTLAPSKSEVVFNITIDDPGTEVGYWTAVAFGDYMASLDAIIVRALPTGKFTVSDEFTQGYGPSKVDEEQNVYNITGVRNDGKLSVQFVRAISPHDDKDDSKLVDEADEEFGIKFWFVPSTGYLAGKITLRHKEHPIGLRVTKKMLYACEHGQNNAPIDFVMADYSKKPSSSAELLFSEDEEVVEETVSASEPEPESEPEKAEQRDPVTFAIQSSINVAKPPTDVNEPTSNENNVEVPTVSRQQIRDQLPTDPATFSVTSQPNIVVIDNGGEHDNQNVNAVATTTDEITSSVETTEIPEDETEPTLAPIINDPLADLFTIEPLVEVGAKVKVQDPPAVAVVAELPTVDNDESIVAEIVEPVAIVPVGGEQSETPIVPQDDTEDSTAVEGDSEINVKVEESTETTTTTIATTTTTEFVSNVPRPKNIPEGLRPARPHTFRVYFE